MDHPSTSKKKPGNSTGICTVTSARVPSGSTVASAPSRNHGAIDSSPASSPSAGSLSEASRLAARAAVSDETVTYPMSSICHSTMIATPTIQTVPTKSTVRLPRSRCIRLILDHRPHTRRHQRHRLELRHHDRHPEPDLHPRISLFDLSALLPGFRQVRGGVFLHLGTDRHRIGALLRSVGCDHEGVAHQHDLPQKDHDRQDHDGYGSELDCQGTTILAQTRQAAPQTTVE